MDTLQLMIVRVFIAWILCICVFVSCKWIYWRKKGNKYLIFDSVDENKEVLKKYAEVWDGIKNKIKVINGGEENDYGKDYMKINLILMMTCH